MKELFNALSNISNFLNEKRFVYQFDAPKGEPPAPEAPKGPETPPNPDKAHEAQLAANRQAGNRASEGHLANQLKEGGKEDVPPNQEKLAEETNYKLHSALTESIGNKNGVLSKNISKQIAENAVNLFNQSGGKTSNDYINQMHQAIDGAGKNLDRLSANMNSVRTKFKQPPPGPYVFM
jgi:hypothetical protein